mgnify:CR=1 FL=1
MDAIRSPAPMALGHAIGAGEGEPDPGVGLPRERWGTKAASGIVAATPCRPSS